MIDNRSLFAMIKPSIKLMVDWGKLIQKVGWMVTREREREREREWENSL